MSKINTHIAFLKDQILKIFKSTLLRNIAIAASGTTVAHAISIAFSPFVTRIYSPESLGQLGIFLAITSILAPVAALSYPIAIVLPEKDADARGIALLSIIVTVTMSANIAILLFFCHEWVLVLLRAQTISTLIWLLPIVILFSGLQQIFQQWLIRKKKFTVIARVAITQALLANSFKIGIGLFYPTAKVLIFLTTFASALSAGLFFFGVTQSKEAHVTKVKINPTTPTLITLTRQYYDFPFFRAPQILINAISQSLPVLILAYSFGSAAAGYYTLSRSVMGLPSNLIGNSVGAVFYPHINEASLNNGNLSKLIIKATLVMAVAGIVPFACAVATAPWLFGVVFGVKWVAAGKYAQCLAIFFFFNFINKPAISAIPVLNLQKGMVLYELFSTSTQIAALYIGISLLKSDTVAVFLFALAGATAYALLILWVIIVSYSRDKISQ